MTIVTIQRGIPGLPYSVNKQEFDSSMMTREEVQYKVIESKAIADMIDETYGVTSPGEVQLAAENKELKLINERLGIDSERKSVMINKLKEAIGEVEFNRIRDEVVESMDYKKITVHSSFT